MPIKIPKALPAKKTLEKENIFIMTDDRAAHQDIRPLKILILNLMPTKIVTETQLMRLLSNNPLQIEVELLKTSSYTSKNTAAEHLDSFYTTFDKISKNKYDGLIITGAPVEDLTFEEVNYWEELCAIMKWSKENVFSTLHICWGAQAGLYYHYGVPKYPMDKKLSGIFNHTVNKPHSALMRGFDNEFWAPHSRYTTVYKEDILPIKELEILSTSKEAGVYVVARKDGRQVFVSGHPEYDIDTLDGEYRRDIDKGLKIDPPANYYKDNNPKNKPIMRWRAHAQLLYDNWLNYCVYQLTPYDINQIK